MFGYHKIHLNLKKNHLRNSYWKKYPGKRRLLLVNEYKLQTSQCKESH